MSRQQHITGAANELLVASRFARAGYAVYYPMLTQSADDLVVCKDGIFQKVQVKTATRQVIKGVEYRQVRLGGAGRTQYVDGDFDILVAVIDETVMLFTWEQVKGKTSMCIGKRHVGTVL